SDSWKLAENDSKALLKLHELLFMDGPSKISSQDIRFMLAHLVSKEFDDLTFQEWQEMAKDVIGYEFKGVELSDSWGSFNYDEKGMPKSAYSRNGVITQPKVATVNGVNVDFYASPDEHGEIDFAADYTPLIGVIVPKKGVVNGKEIYLPFTLP